MITREDLNKVRTKARSIRALVIGDVMLDRYIYGIVDRISPEAPVPVLLQHNTQLKAGGAANVALNLAAWGCKTSLIGLVGGDANAKELSKLLDKESIHHHLLVSDSRPTTQKTRVVAASHHLLRIDEESREYLSETEEKKIADQVSLLIAEIKPDLIIIEDYNKGFLTENIIRTIIESGRKLSAFVAVDPKEKNFDTYKGVQLFKPNLREAAHYSNRNLELGDLPEVASTWNREMAVDLIAITLGSQGIFMHNHASNTQIKPGLAIDIVDVCGAGDAVICTLALASLAGLDIQESGELANLTGAYVCSHSGVVAVDLVEIEGWL
jgi:rfaE bifunctional protein kinase chain/domain